jgi:acyl carrier protein
MFDIVVSILGEYQNIAKEQIHADSQLVTDLGLSSFDVVSLGGRFEDEFDIEVPDRQIKKLRTVNDIVLLIEDIKANQ